MRQMLLTGLLCLIMGGLAGFFAGRRSMENARLQDGAISAMGTIARSRILLDQVNKGNTKAAASLLRSTISVETMQLDAFVHKLPERWRDTNLVSALESARAFVSNRMQEASSQKVP